MVRILRPISFCNQMLPDNAESIGRTLHKKIQVSQDQKPFSFVLDEARSLHTK
jgi:hypothetical protein